MCAITWVIFVFFAEMRVPHVAQAGLKLLASSDPPALASQVLGFQMRTTTPGLQDLYFSKNLYFNRKGTLNEMAAFQPHQ